MKKRELIKKYMKKWNESNEKHHKFRQLKYRAKCKEKRSEYELMQEHYATSIRLYGEFLRDLEKLEKVI